MDRDMDRGDVVVVGAGIVGLATARAILTARPASRVIVLDKEAATGQHQSGRNSGVIHAGVYYPPGSDKARLCTAGRMSMVEYSRQHGIAHEVCGKVVVATDDDERGRLSELERRCRANGVRVELIGVERLREIEPHVNAVAALHVLDSGITDYPAGCRSLAGEIEAAGGVIQLDTAVVSGVERAEGLVIETSRGEVAARRVVTCAGLQADRVAVALSGPGGAAGLRIVPFRGEYYELVPERSHLVRTLVYPVPDPQFPFLGVHLTRGVAGNVHVGPNAVLALAREGYSWREIDLTDVRDTVAFPGFRKLARRYWRYGAGEMARSLSKRRFTKALQRLVPEVSARDLEPAPAGVRAQALTPEGTLVDDFAFQQVGRALHVLNAPSPAATASLEIGRAIAARLALDE
ncbi:MAG: L-2-hydroxyglutarate oxidase [Acidimicrobiia bacterium]